MTICFPHFVCCFLNATLLIAILTLLCITTPPPPVSIFCNHLGAGLCAVHDGVAAVERKGILKFSQTLLGKFIPGVNHPPICLQNNDMAVNCCFHHSFSFVLIPNHSTYLSQAVCMVTSQCKHTNTNKSEIEKPRAKEI